jgi:septal ring factor EnvC (AmiA/AmiB activator)
MRRTTRPAWRFVLAALLALPLALPGEALPRESTAPSKKSTTKKAPAKKPAAKAPAPAADPSEEELKRLKEAAEEKRRQARELQGKEKSILGQLRKSDEALGATRRYLTRLDTQEKILENEILRREDSLTEAGIELERRRLRLTGWMREAYKRGRTRHLEIFFSSADFGDLMKRTYFLSMVMQQEKDLMEAVREQKAVVEQEKAELVAREREVEGLRGEKERERQKYQSLKDRQSTEVSKVRSQRRSFEQAAKELEAAATRMQKLLAELEAQRRRRVEEGKDQLTLELDRNNFGANRGRLPWPVTGELIGRFGLEKHPEWGTQIRNNGVDIRAPEGTAVRSVGDGRVELVDWLPGYGQSVIVNHGQGYYSVYAHLGGVSVDVGQKVAAGTTVGTVGDSGSLKGTCLHFELRKGREAQNPEGWLR